MKHLSILFIFSAITFPVFSQLETQQAETTNVEPAYTEQASAPEAESNKEVAEPSKAVSQESGCHCYHHEDGFHLHVSKSTIATLSNYGSEAVKWAYEHARDALHKASTYTAELTKRD